MVLSDRDAARPEGWLTSRLPAKVAEVFIADAARPEGRLTSRLPAKVAEAFIPDARARPEPYVER
ncbi:MAG: hypothetical protein JNJ54_34260 [Myxococcaceae bacterium]|nr:hypothetical protein [Myxococcaceae bacterium]